MLNMLDFFRETKAGNNIFMKRIYCYYLILLILFCSFEKISLADEFKDLEYDKNRLGSLLRSGQDEKECKAILKILTKYNDNEKLLNIDLNEAFTSIVKDYSSSITLIELINHLKGKININYVDANGYTPLMYAVISSEKVPVAEHLIKLGADVNKVASANKPPFPYLDIFNDITHWYGYDYVSRANLEKSYKYNFSPLLLAATYNRNPQMIDLLLDSGADKNLTDPLGRNALELAVYYNHNSKIATKLIERGLYNNRKSEYSEPLIHLAVIKNDYDLVKSLLDRNTYLYQKSFSGKDLMTVIAEYCRDVKIAKLLFNSGLKISDKYILKTVLEKNHSDVISFIFEEAYKNQEFKKNKNIWSELLLTAICNNSSLDKVIKKLIEMGADPNYKNNSGKNSFLLAVQYYKNNKIYHLLEQAGADIYAKDEHEKNAFRLAVNNNNIKLAEALLVNYKYDVYSKDNLGRNAIWEWYGNSRNFYYDIPVLDFLLNIGYDINSTDDTFGDTLLLKAASDVRNFQLLEYLLKKGANLEVKNKYGDTALMRTAKRDGLNCNFFALIKAGANINVSDNYGSTLLSSLIYREKEFFSYYLYSKSCKSFPWYLLYVINYNLFEKENDEDLCDCENQK